MKILVTGGCGFIGSHIVDSLIGKGHEVLIFDNLSTGKKDYIPKGVELFKGDITEPKQVEKAFSKFNPDVVVHTAAQVMLRKSLEEPLFDAKTNVFGTINVMEACQKHKESVKKIIYTGTGGAAYGEPKKLPVPETADKIPLSPYGCSKVSAEYYVRSYCINNGFDHLIFRFGNVYGPRDNPDTKRVIPIFVEGLMKGKDFSIFGDGKQTRDFLYVKDIARLVAENIEQTTGGKTYNLASGEGTSVNKVYETVAKGLGIDKEAPHKEAIKGEVRFIFLDIKKAKKELGFKPTSFEDGMKETIEWFKAPNKQ
ncbi:GDP-mannose 4,6-dehydratase [Candidatus Woesearchaeota archaeon]|nr:GDP-mannose 4,6-dehydratase [Candidatus Woesearchaeota archaeon]